VINQVKFRVARAEKAWNETLELLRAAAAAPGYCGPELRSVERAAGEVATVHEMIWNWALEDAQRGRPRGPRRREVRAAIQTIKRIRGRAAV
jgi:hypothetical protein